MTRQKSNAIWADLSQMVFHFTVLTSVVKLLLFIRWIVVFQRFKLVKLNILKHSCYSCIVLRLIMRVESDRAIWEQECTIIDLEFQY